MMLLTKEIVNAFERQGDTSQRYPDEIKIICKLFNPTGAGTWYLYERLDEDTFMCFADLGDPQMAECSTVSLSELKSFKGMFGLGIERDRWFDIGEKTLQEVIDKIKGGGHV